MTRARFQLLGRVLRSPVPPGGNAGQRPSAPIMPEACQSARRGRFSPTRGRTLPSSRSARAGGDTATRAPFRLGLTGSIGMGKSTTAGLFAAAGVPVWDADAAVHRLYAPGGGGAAALAEIVPEALRGDAVDRDALRAAVAADPALLPRIEARVHPRVAADRQAFLAAQAEAPLVLLDIPLLYETGAEAGLDGVLVVTAPPEVQRARVLARPGMTPAALDRLLARQMPDADKRARADFVIATDQGLEAARVEVHSLIAKLTAGDADA